VQEFFAHLEDVQPFFKALVKSGKFQENMELARGHFARGIERRLAELPRGRSIPPNELPAIAFTHAGALLSLLTWWLDRGMRESPAEMDQLFHRIVWNGLGAK
jgi:AcrR family transcriptional regulator